MSTKKITIFTILFFSLLFISCVFADYNPEKWQYFKDIKIGSAPASGDLIEVALDQDAFNNAKNDLSDLRIINAKGDETAYKLVIEKGTFSQKNIYPIKILNNSFVPGQYNLFVIDFGQSGFLNSGLKILTASENFRRQVEISGSNDMQNWNVLKTDGYIYDYTDRRASFKAQNTTVDYPENTYRYLHVKIFMGGEASLTINTVQVSRISVSAIKETVLAPKYDTYEQNRVSGVIIDLEKKGWPTSSILLNSPDGNFNREVVVYESNDRNNWRLLGQGYIFSYNTPKFKGANLSLVYTESNSRYLKVEIYNGDNRPISITGLSVKAILRNIVFQYEPVTSYRLYYGNNQARFPEYDIEKFFAYLDTGRYTNAALSAEKKNPLFKPEIPPKLPLSERIPFLLPSVLILAVLILGFFVFRFFKQVK